MKRMNKMKNGAARIAGGVAAGMTVFAGVGLMPLTAFAQSQELACICEEKCSADAINEECAVCLYDYNCCEGVENEVQKNDGPLTPDGNMNLVDDYGSSSEAGKQFITVTTKSGNYFYLIIDRDDKGTETVHFLNLVDEADLLALMEDDEVESYMNSQGLTAADETVEVETTTEPATEETTEEAEVPDTENKGKNVTGAMAVVLIVTVGGIGGYMYMKSNKGKKKANAPDPDADYFDGDDDEDYLADLEIDETEIEESEPYVEDKISDADISDYTFDAPDTDTVESNPEEDED